MRGTDRGPDSSHPQAVSGWLSAAPPAVATRGSRPFSSAAAACLSVTLPELDACGQSRNLKLG